MSNSANFRPSRVLVRLLIVIEMTGLRKSSIYNRLNESSKYFDPTFPKQVSLAANASDRGAAAWDLAEIEAWITNRLAMR